jgi:acetoin utilization protein AcuB
MMAGIGSFLGATGKIKGTFDVRDRIDLAGVRIALSSEIILHVHWVERSEVKFMFENLSEKSSRDEGREISLVIGPAEVADVMTGKVVTLSPHHTLSEVANLMSDRYFRHCVVVDSFGKIAGVISDRDILRALARNPNSRSKSLDQIMTRNPITVKRTTPIVDAVSKLLAKRINCLPVVEEDGSVCGIVTSTDLLKSYQQLLELMRKQAG